MSHKTGTFGGGTGSLSS